MSEIDEWDVELNFRIGDGELMTHTFTVHSKPEGPTFDEALKEGLGYVIGSPGLKVLAVCYGIGHCGGIRSYRQLEIVLRDSGEYEVMRDTEI